jgi:hypothetical protein
MASWSKTAASNDVADANVNMAEGMAPSAVNNGVRAVMASAAMYRDDVSGSLTTGGTATAYTLTTNQGFASLAALDGRKLIFKVNATSGASPTLAVDGLTAKPINYSTGVAVPTGFLVNGSVYTVTYSSSGNEYLLHGAYDRSTLGDTTINGSLSVTSTASFASQVFGASVGSVGAPSFTFSTDGNTGIYRIGADNIGVAANGAKVLDISASGLSVTGSVTASNGLTVSAGVVTLPSASIANAALVVPPAMVKIGATQTASTSAALNFTSNIDSTYRSYVFLLENIRPDTTNAQLQMQVSDDGGSTWKTTSYIGAMINASSAATGNLTSTSAVPLNSTDASSTAGYGLTGEARIYTPASTTVRKRINVLVTYRSSSNIELTQTGGGAWDGNTAITAVRFKYSSGNILDGTITMFGIT